ncbi:nuclear transport factor 2 family protein [Streptomyces sp. WMMC500]|uniref:nuclear transport factor 2 family protein n=1 Tax=Streptomyces sp. WMMC500 TaxID=3015154 RepID=UPI00248B47CF|nr:nuclear transport factor 2 family protein [Streptomyces sp. WMMC500]WBB60939.1 nuclear transport factor 2 family protein [Streptomyces sp. WMMC500]
MLDEDARKHVALEYCRRINESDVDGVLGLFADPLHVEDPVGDKTFIERAAYRAHIARLVSYGVYEIPGAPVAGLDREHVALPITVELRPEGVPRGKFVRISLIAVMRVGGEGLIRHMRVISGRTDMSLHDAAEAADAARFV